SRAADLIDPQDPSLIELLMELGMAYSETSDLTTSERVMERCVQVAEAYGDELLTARARVTQGMFSFWGHPTDEYAGHVEREAEAWLRRFDDAGDVAGVAMASATIGNLAWGRCRARDAAGAWRRAIDGFRTTGNKLLSSEYIGWMSSTIVWGPTPCDDAVRELQALAEEAHGSPIAEADVNASLGDISMFLGDLDGARARFEQADRMKRETGRMLSLAHSSQQIGLLEMLSRN